MTTVLIIVCIVFCIGVIVAIVGHMGVGIALDKGHRGRIHGFHLTRNRAGASSREPQAAGSPPETSRTR